MDRLCVLRAFAPARMQDGVLSEKERMRVQKGAGVRVTPKKTQCLPGELRTELGSQTLDSEQPKWVQVRL